MRLPEPPLLVITDRRQASAPLPVAVQAVCAVGCRWLSIREKDLPAPAQIALARELLAVTRRNGAQLLLNGAPELAKTAGLDGVHLAAGSDAREARALLGQQALVGISVHTLDEVRALEANLVDYALVGPAFLTASKPGYGPALGPCGLQAFVNASAVPVIAIGGIEASRVGALMAAGAAGIAVMGAVMRAQAPEVIIAALLAELERCAPSACPTRLSRSG